VGQTNKVTIDGTRINIRPEHIYLSSQPEPGKRAIAGEVTDLIFIGSITRFRFKSSEGISLTSTNVSENIQVGDAVYASWDKEREFLVQ
jgi:ABC-type Fe3+/spermidine/putrescine transport system ATPase subunit